MRADGRTVVGEAVAGVPGTFDHLVVAVPDLAAGVAEFEQLTRVRSVPGGSHPGRGTANHLVPMVPRGWGAESLTYLEILGPDPEQDSALAARSLPGVTGICAQRWAVRPDDLDGTVQAADAAGVDYGSVFDMARSTPDGGRLEWRLTRRAPLAFGGAQPFLIDWGTSPHPADTLREHSSGRTAPAVPAGASGDFSGESTSSVVTEPAVTLDALEFFGPDQTGLTAAIGTLAAARTVVAEASEPGFRAVLSTPRGELTITSVRSAEGV
ncbi:VOC family protein [Brevibacterium jeotgali]|uniref:Glyoxalase-like domain-containing protein n=1 Tax=Brevibacterium jeotgali TaxID=1262550 RepID=A0A2H1L3I1_9MICO|nr:VOC family protein [Brevibacterium jeotgali]TWC01719.1 glyoxalase-like protein [Brevibacterium jeotgali]SMY11464.1 Glyoxalase-like domain-containing protein [Brevibacterium jeotgali]